MKKIWKWKILGIEQDPHRQASPTEYKRLLERITGIEDIIERMATPVKENVKSKNTLAQDIQKIWDTVKRSKSQIIGIEEGEETYIGQRHRNISIKTIEENYTKIKEMCTEVQEAYNTPNRLCQK